MYLCRKDKGPYMPGMALKLLQILRRSHPGVNIGEGASAT
jgi:hypothetical protein